MTSVSDLLDEFVNLICSEASLIEAAITKPADSFCSSLFDLPKPINHVNERESLRARLGIYLFFMTYDIDLSFEDVKAWNSVSGGASFTTVGAKSLRIGDCLYLGSCIKNSLYSRMGQHFGPLIENGRTKGLSLSHPKREKLKDKVCALAFPLKNEYKKYAPMLLPHIEKELHNTLKAKVGSNRV